MENNISLNPNPLVNFFGKGNQEITMTDIIDYVTDQGIKMVDLMYPAEDGRVKTLNFVINNREHLESVLTDGERVDGSSLFPSFVDAENSDLYVVPRFRTAFLNPFSDTPTLCLICSFFSKDGTPFDCSPEQTLHRAAQAFTESTGMTFEAMGELEYYVIASDDGLFPAVDQRGYHESGPFAKFNEFRKTCMLRIASAGGLIKYGHSEVGNFTEDGKVYEQNEIEFLPCPAEEAADQLLIAKWIIRNTAREHGLDVTFTPKITTGKAGSGLHIHIRIMKDGHNMMLRDGKLSREARKAIAGMLELAPSITAFGNKTPVSYFRLVPHQEAPTNVCWGDCNRSVLVRVPLGWTSGLNMSRQVNPEEPDLHHDTSLKQTVEMRSPDGSADVYQLIAGLCTACRRGLEMDDDKALEMAERMYVPLGERTRGLDRFEQLPSSCAASAEWLSRQRKAYEEKGVFSTRMIDGIMSKLISCNDADMRQRAEHDDRLMRHLVASSFYCG